MDDALDLAGSTRRLSFAAGASGALHVIAALTLAWQLPARPSEASSEAAIEFTVDLVSPPASATAARQQAPPEVPPEAPPEQAVAAEATPPALPLPDVKPLSELIPPPPEPAPPPHAPPPGETLEHALSAPDEPPVIANADFAQAAPRPGPPPVPKAPPPQAKPVTPAPRLALNGARENSRRKTEEDYLEQLIRKLPRTLYFPKTREASDRGVVVTRVTVARNGRLLDVVLTRSSGSPEVDQGLIQSIRKASPFAPLPPDLPDSQLSFVVPINYTRQGAQR